jgi:transcriptional regulator with XRE-family HTH domain
MTFLRKARKRKQLSQVALAAKIGTTQAHISALERGDVGKPSWDTVGKLAKVLDVRPEQLFPIDFSEGV